MLIYYAERHMQKALAPTLFHGEELDEQRKKRDPVADEVPLIFLSATSANFTVPPQPPGPEELKLLQFSLDSGAGAREYTL